MPDPKLTEEEMERMLKVILDKVGSLTFQFRTDQEKKQEWESTSVTLQHIQDIKTELEKITTKPESEYGSRVLAIMTAINNDLFMLEISINQHEATIKSSRAQNKKRQYEASGHKFYETNANEKIKETIQAIDDFMGKLQRNEAHLIPVEKVSAVETDLKTLNIDSKRKILLEANLRLVKDKIKNSQHKLDGSTPDKRIR
jgi:hypothetical protein